MQVVSSQAPEGSTGPGAALPDDEKLRQNKAAIAALGQPVPQRELVFQWTDPAKTQQETYRFIQEELGMFPIQEFTDLVTDILNDLITGDMGIKIGDLFRGEMQLPTLMDGNAVDDAVDENMQLINAFVKLVKIAPEFQKETICLSLGIPKAQRPWAKDQMALPPSRGGLTVNDGFDILEWFIKQNGPLLKDTVRGNAKRLVKTFRLEVLGQAVVEETPEPQAVPAPETTASPTSQDQTPTQVKESSPGGTPSSTSLPVTPVKS